MKREPVIRLRRVYDPPEPGADGPGVPPDGVWGRILVDRLWPRGLAKAVAGVRGHLPAVAGGEWPKAVTPSTELRRWFHDGGSAGEFRERYEAEPGAVAEPARLRSLAEAGPLTLLTAVKDPASSHAAILAERLAD
ncbi:DUF488 domain-containing protein [Streptomyces virginiae]|uniref:DUF488 family protein n=1 Tax=Streptomyces virginiae TaxID=1961 RepID=A0ABZ1TF95_STRVG|nr:DUF488 family protein [Streptomyces virginiae]WTB24487.1 DUF488 family protein [Streptomyces virginiae]